MSQGCSGYEMEAEVFKSAHDLLQIASKRHQSADLLQIERAIIFANGAHKGQFRMSGECYIMHPIAAAIILADQHFDTGSIITALLHDTVEDTDISCSDIEREFSSEIAELVDGVTKLKKIDYQPVHIRQAENFRKLLLAMSKDLRVLLVKLADRIHNMQTLNSFQDREKHLRIAYETIEIYAPLAERVGMHKFKNELEDLAFSIIYPEIRNSMKSRLSFLTIKDKLLIEVTKEELANLLAKHNIKAEISGRQKTPYSIWNKMERKRITFDQLSDIIAFRIVLDSVEDCYKVLGLIHTSYKIIINGFKDYISLPKANGYRSLHTLVIGDSKQRIEIQIRTREMDEIAKFGLAAHWAYKGQVEHTDDKRHDLKWANELIEILKHTSNPEEVLENTKLDLYNDQVFCFTPEGGLISLPKGATPVDFAFAMHSRIGLTCIGAKVNGRDVKLNHSLENGDQVEIITSPYASPSRTWENFIVTGKARAGIRKFIKATQQSELINLGRVVLIKALSSAKDHYNEKKLLPLLRVFQKKTIDDLLFAVGRGAISKIEVMQALHLKSINSENATKKSMSLLKLIKKSVDSNIDDKIVLHGLIPGMNMIFASCCNPLPGDKIVGIIHPSQGITVHATGCGVLSDYADHPEKWLGLAWGNNDQRLYASKILISIANQPNSLSQVANCIREVNYNVISLKMINKKYDLSEIILGIEVKGVQQLNEIMMSLKKLPLVYGVERFINQR